MTSEPNQPQDSKKSEYIPKYKATDKAPPGESDEWVLKWLILAGIVGIVMGIGALRGGSLSGKGVGGEGAMGCGGGPAVVSNGKTIKARSVVHPVRRVVIPRHTHIKPKLDIKTPKAAKVLPLEQLLKKMKKEKLARSANPKPAPRLRKQPKEVLGKESPKVVKVLPLEQLLKKIKEKRKTQLTNPSPRKIQDKKPLFPKGTKETKAAKVLPLPELLKKIKASKQKKAKQ